MFKGHLKSLPYLSHLAKNWKVAAESLGMAGMAAGRAVSHFLHGLIPNDATLHDTWGLWIHN